MPKHTSQAKAMSKSERIKLGALAVTKLCLTEGISKAVSQAISQKKIPLNYFYLNSVAIF